MPVRLSLSLTQIVHAPSWFWTSFLSMRVRLLTPRATTWPYLITRILFQIIASFTTSEQTDCSSNIRYTCSCWHVWLQTDSLVMTRCIIITNMAVYSCINYMHSWLDFHSEPCQQMSLLAFSALLTPIVFAFICHQMSLYVLQLSYNVGIVADRAADGLLSSFILRLPIRIRQLTQKRVQYEGVTNMWHGVPVIDRLEVINSAVIKS